MNRFNPSVGILFVHTDALKIRAGLHVQFQSLGRDSVCSYETKRSTPIYHVAVSIPRSGFCLFIPYCAASIVAALHVSIPRSGFCLFILRLIIALNRLISCFNPSVGILFVHTRPPERSTLTRARFNPSVGILFVHTRTCLPGAAVAPRFQSLGRDSVCSYGKLVVQWHGILARFNPSVGILFVHTGLMIFFASG